MGSSQVCVESNFCAQTPVSGKRTRLLQVVVEYRDASWESLIGGTLPRIASPLSPQSRFLGLLRKRNRCGFGCAKNDRASRRIGIPPNAGNGFLQWLVLRKRVSYNLQCLVRSNIWRQHKPQNCSSEDSWRWIRGVSFSLYAMVLHMRRSHSIWHLEHSLE